MNVKHLEILHRLSKEPHATELRHRRTPPRLPLHSGNQVSSLRRIDWSDQSAVAILLCSPNRNTAFVARGLAQKRLPPANGGITSPEHMKTKTPRIFATATVLVWTVLLWGCASSHVDQAPQNESHENISPEQKEAVLKALRLHASRDLYIIPNIPPNKLANARQSCAVAADDEVLALVDTSAMRSAKSCLVVATSGIYVKNDLIADSPGRSFLPYSGFVDGGIKRSQRNEVSIGGVTFNMAWCSIPKDEMIQMLSDVQVRLRR